MKWTFHPTNKEVTTSLPLSVEISSWEGRPKVFLQGTGELGLKPTSSGTIKTDFHVFIPGTYTIKLVDASGTQEFQFEALEHRYLNFTEEFGFFFILFLFVMGGIVLWTRKIMRKKVSAK